MSKINWIKERIKDNEFSATFTRQFSDGLSKECMLLGAILIKGQVVRQHNYTWTEGNTAYDIFFQNGQYKGDRTKIVVTVYQVAHNQTTESIQTMLDFARTQDTDHNTLAMLQQQIANNLKE